jgi:class 3 adenylate cyclase
MDAMPSEGVLEDILAKIERSRNWSPRVMAKLENSVRTADEEDLFRLNPIAWAQKKNIDENEAIDLFLHSAKAGLFNMDWNVICPCCGMITRSLRSLHGMRSRNVCSVCFRDDRATLDDYVQVSFTVSPAVREISFHHPETLSLEDYCYRYLFARGAKYGPGLDLTLAQFLQYAQRHFSEFLPGGNVVVETDIDCPGILFVNDLIGLKGFALIVDGERTEDVQEIAVRLADERFDVPLQELRPGEYQVAHKFMTSDFFYRLPQGKIRLELQQASASKAALIVWFAPLEDIARFPDIEFGPSLTAKRLFACQTFHDLFRSEVFQETEGFGVKDVTILFTDLKSSTQLYNQIGDLNAFARVREHYGILNTAIVNEHGAVVKTIGDAIMATFTRPEAAVCAAFNMLRDLRKLNTASQDGSLILKIGIHRGAAISVTLNERLDYFGQTVNIAARVQGLAGGDEIYVTDDVYTSPGVRELLGDHHCDVEPMQIELKGIVGGAKVYKITGSD